MVMQGVVRLELVMLMALPAALAAQTPRDTSVRAPADSSVRQSTDTSVHPIRLDQAIQLAQRNAPIAVQALGQIQTTRAQQRSAWAAFIPSVTLSASSSRQGGDRFDPQGRLVPYTGQPWQLSNGLSLNVNLFNGGQRFFNLRSTRAQVNAAQANEVAQRFQVALQVNQQYFAVLAAREAEAAARSQLQEAQQQLASANAQLRVHMVTKSDSLQAVVQVGNAQLALLTAQNDILAANAALTRLVATPFTVTASLEDTLGVTTESLDSAAIQHLAENGPAVLQAQASQTAARASASAARSPYLPTLTLGFTLAGNGSDSSFALVAGRYAYQNQLRIGLSYPIFDQLQREQGITVADVAARNAEAELRDARLAARQGFVQYYSALRTAEQQVSIQNASIAAAEENLRVVRQRYQLRTATFLDVLTAEATLIQARSALIQARYNYRVAKAQLEALIGRPL
jgi:outer membrane protein